MVKYLFIPVLYSGILIGQVFNGMTLFSPTQGGGGGGNFYTYLTDNDMNVLHSWSHPRGAASMAYLMSDSILYYPYRVQNPTMTGGGVGGGVSKYNWEGDLLWSYEIANESYQHHHDIEPLPNGNVLLIAWELKTAEEAYAAGRQEINNSLNVMWSEAVFELEPVGSDNVNIVWEWHLWDHLIQDADPSAENYGVVSEHPELQDVNFGNAGSNQGPGGPNGDWKHFNAIAYNAELNQIVVSSRHHSEIYIIDHSTTSEEASTHSGGNSGMGGDFLYRWGNPQVYDRGTGSDQTLNHQHGVNWISDGYPGGGNLILYNNDYANNSSAVFEIETPVNTDGTYDLEPNQPFGPDVPVWMHTGNFHTQMQGGAFRLPNGNTFITDCDDAIMFEVTNDHQVVWSHDYGGGQTFIARAQKYPMDYLGGGFPEYIIGDINFDGVIDVLDINYLVDMTMNYGYEPTPPADFNNDGNVNISDVIFLVQFILTN